MLKLFFNTVSAYLEDDLNNFIKNSNCEIVNVFYSTCILEGELMHNVLLYYMVIPIQGV